jgi:peptide/nickel transport system permease protein
VRDAPILGRLLRRLLRRLVHAAAVVVAASTASFVLLHLAPGDPITTTLEHPSITPAARDSLRARYGLDRPLAEQYGRWLAAAARGDLGWSPTQRRPVREALAAALPRSALLVGTALVASFAAGVTLGAFAGWRPRHPAARLLGGAAVVLHATPEFVLGLLLVATVALRFALLPTGGYSDAGAESTLAPAALVLDRLRHLALPATALALGWTAVIARHQRAALADVAGTDFVRTARAKGLPERRVFARHALRAALAPTLALVGLTLPALVGGAVVTESVFAWPGMGLLAAQAVGGRDYPLVAGAVVVGSAVVAVGAALADALAAWADPRAGRGGE